MTQTSPTWYIILILQGAIYGMAQTIPDKSMVTDLVGCFLNALYSTYNKMSSNQILIISKFLKIIREVLLQRKPLWKLFKQYMRLNFRWIIVCLMIYYINITGSYLWYGPDYSYMIYYINITGSYLWYGPDYSRQVHGDRLSWMFPYIVTFTLKNRKYINKYHI
jgi:hypothetical protein